MAIPYSNGASPEGPVRPSPEEEIAARQAQVEQRIKDLVDARVNEIIQAIQARTPQVLASSSETAPTGTTSPPGTGAGGIIAALVAHAPAITDAFVGALNAWTQAKIISNPLSHLEMISKTNPRLLSLYAPNPLGDQFMNIYATAFSMGMRAASTGRQIALGPGLPPAPLVPSVPSLPGVSAGPSENPSAAPPSGSPGSPENPKPSDGKIIMGMGDVSDKMFEEMLKGLSEEYRRRRVANS